MEELTLQIIKTALSEFIQYGVRRISIDEICSDLRISKKTFYQVFQKKEDLLDAVLEYQQEILMEEFEKTHSHLNAIDSLLVITKNVKRHTKDDCVLFYYDLEKYYPALYEKHKEVKSKWVTKYFEKNLQKGIAEGYYREDLDVELSALFHAIQLNSSFQELAHLAKKKSKKEIIDFYIDLVVRLITNEKGLKYIKENSEKN